MWQFIRVRVSIDIIEIIINILTMYWHHISLWNLRISHFQACRENKCIKLFYELISSHCPTNYTCLGDIGDNPNDGFTNFDNFGWAMLNAFQLITLDFWEDPYNKVRLITSIILPFYKLLYLYYIMAD